jgi:alkylhydroperoxidase family enzyme
MSYLPSSPGLENIAELLAKYPRRGFLLFKLLEDIKGCFSPLSKGVRELIIAYTCDLNQSESCYRAYKSLFKELAIDESVYDQLKLDIECAKVDEKLKPLLRFVKKLTLTPDQIIQADVNLIYKVGWGERALLDTVRLCAVVNCRNRFTMGVGIGKKAVHSRRAHPAIKSTSVYHS